MNLSFKELYLRFALSLLAILTFLLAPITFASSVKAVASQYLDANVPTVSFEESLELISRFGLATENAQTEEIQALGRSLKQIITYLDGQDLPSYLFNKWDESKPFALYPFRFIEANKNSSQHATHIEISRRGSNKFGENPAQLLHEYGHYIGNKPIKHLGNKSIYSLYWNYINDFCVVSSYSRTNRNENFAEVFSAFLTAPHLILNNNSEACRNACLFFSISVFKNPNLQSRCYQEYRLPPPRDYPYPDDDREPIAPIEADPYPYPSVEVPGVNCTLPTEAPRLDIPRCAGSTPNQ